MGADEFQLPILRLMPVAICPQLFGSCIQECHIFLAGQQEPGFHSNSTVIADFCHHRRICAGQQDALGQYHAVTKLQRQLLILTNGNAAQNTALEFHRIKPNGPQIFIGRQHTAAAINTIALIDRIEGNHILRIETVTQVQVNMASDRRGTEFGLQRLAVCFGQRDNKLIDLAALTLPQNILQYMVILLRCLLRITGGAVSALDRADMQTPLAVKRLQIIQAPEMDMGIVQ